HLVDAGNSTAQAQELGDGAAPRRHDLTPAAGGRRRGGLRGNRAVEGSFCLRLVQAADREQRIIASETRQRGRSELDADDREDDQENETDDGPATPRPPEHRHILLNVPRRLVIDGTAGSPRSSNNRRCRQLRVAPATIVARLSLRRKLSARL